MSSIGTELMQTYKDLTDIELIELQIKFAKFNKELKESYDSKIEAIEKNIDAQISFYKRQPEDCQVEKQKILSKYTEEFQKIYDERKVQFYNIENEIAEIQANQKIALTNFYKTTDDRRKSLEESEDSLEKYTNTLIGLLQKYNGYDALIKECNNKLEECLNASKEDFEEIAKYRNQSLSIVNKRNPIMNILNKIINKFTGASKFNKEFVNKMEKELLDIEANNNSIINEIRNQTNSIVALIEEVRNEINSQFKITVG